LGLFSSFSLAMVFVLIETRTKMNIRIHPGEKICLIGDIKE